MSDDMQVNENKQPAEIGLEIAVLGSARLTENDEWWAQAYKLGALLAKEGYVIVTGGYGGLMTAASRGAHEAGGRAIGLPMQHWTGIAPNPWNADLRWSSNYGTRLNYILHCDAVIALPGGVGTLSEMAIAWSCCDLRQVQKKRCESCRQDCRISGLDQDHTVNACDT